MACEAGQVIVLCDPTTRIAKKAIEVCFCHQISETVCEKAPAGHAVVVVRAVVPGIVGPQYADPMLVKLLSKGLEAFDTTGHGFDHLELIAVIRTDHWICRKFSTVSGSQSIWQV